MIEQDDDIYRTLLESTKAIPWKINWETKAFEYIGPQIETLLGWRQDSWTSAQDWIDRIHEEDREQTAHNCINLCENGIDHEADYRALTADGEYVWVRDVVHVIRKNGVTTDLVGFIFDISERKAMEEALQQANEKLEALSYLDGLTGVPNRRLYDKTLEREWEHAVRTATAVSLVVIDIDHFKDYNDQYGHIQGDECLKQVAEALQKVAVKSTDFFARYGGEEFVLLLPDTGQDAARDIAEQCRRRVLELAIEHPASTAGHLLTISAGVASMIPTEDDPLDDLFSTADRMLYQAKRNGRNRFACSWSQGVARKERESC
ncbi:PAS domain S-box-containing protein/diguanylate cyclase (GGDEF) domain-containing protein [Amphritea atlantica]|uniref:diguanylate cyclase n=1 Tax=Amphritea atlantica TaxID=355243 RepID=A0A1H9KZS5_9GAMM|nr:sensor domain-containing diguanylate cyclase [Amphritea atlantica]SER04509.1 PAS domain S-box-containing protein/diguanylate cyclase (GGDEF) domain-containing protein [Amphritea atlantica]